MLHKLRREFTILYGEDYATRVLEFCLRNYCHSKADELQREAGLTGQGEAA